MTHSHQLVADRPADAHEAGFASPQAERPTLPWNDTDERSDGERAARTTLRGQVGRLERELSAIVAERFPYISAAPVLADEAGGAEARCFGPSLLGIEELERTRDRLAGRVQELRRCALERDEHERRAHEQLQRMKLEPGRFKFARLPVRDLGQGGCGVWQVRPRLGLIGMLAGWWQVKLSSGCPLARGSRSRRGSDRQT